MQEFEELYKTYFPLVYRYLLSLCHDELLAEELTQETFFKVLKKSKSFRGQCKFSTWMCQIAKNTYYSYLKKNQRLTALSSEALPRGPEENPETLVADKELALSIQKALHSLHEPYQSVFYMRAFEELSFPDIARIHKKSESWARVTYHRAKLKIREELE